MTRYRAEGADAKFTVVQWNGGRYNPRDTSDGANVGVQYATAIAYPMPVIFYSIGGEIQLGPPRTFGWALAGDMYRVCLQNLLRESDIPQTISISYGYCTPSWISRSTTGIPCAYYSQSSVREA